VCHASVAAPSAVVDRGRCGDIGRIFTPDELVALRELLNRLLVSAREVSEHDPPPKAR
jgi:predicted methyltransferase MtxX (methanogen marker protein 4)